MSIKAKDLKDIAKKINEVAELESDEKIDPNQNTDELKAELEAAVAGKDTEDGEPEIEITEDDDFSEHQWSVLAELGCPAALEEGESEEGESEDDEGVDDSEGEEPEEDDEPEEEEAEEGVTYEDLQKMTKKKDLKTVIEEHELDIDASKYKKVDELREAIAEALDLVESEEEEEPEEEPEEGEAEVPSEEDIKSMKKKDLKQVVEDHELDVDTSQKLDALREDVAEALHGEPEEEEEGEPEEEEPEVPAYEQVMAMKKKDLKQVVEDHELEVDTDQKLDALREDVAEALELEEPESDQGEEEPEVPSYDDLQDMKKKQLKEVIEEHELDVDDSQKAADLRESVAEALGVAPKKSKGKGKDKKTEEKSKGKESKSKEKKSEGEYKGTTKERVEFLTPYIEKGTYTKKELLDIAQKQFPGATRSALQTLLTDAKNSKYNRFEKLVVQDDEKHVMFEGKSKGKSKGKKSKSKSK